MRLWSKKGTLDGCKSLPEEVKMITLVCMVLHKIFICKRGYFAKNPGYYNCHEPETESSEIQDFLHMNVSKSILA